jgi:hypothetical protein
MLEQMMMSNESMQSSAPAAKPMVEKMAPKDKANFAKVIASTSSAIFFGDAVFPKVEQMIGQSKNPLQPVVRGMAMAIAKSFQDVESRGIPMDPEAAMAGIIKFVREVLGVMAQKGTLPKLPKEKEQAVVAAVIAAMKELSGRTGKQNAPAAEPSAPAEPAGLLGSAMAGPEMGME